MNQPFYPFIILDEARRFDFVSVGHKTIRKTVVFDRLDKSHVYNLMLADVTEDGDEDVYVVSNNGDMRKVLATVFQCIIAFLSEKPHAVILFYGSTPERTDIYHWAIGRELAKVSERFHVQGFNGGDFEPFNPMVRYSAFAISLKN